MENSKTTMESIVEVPQKTKNRTTIRFSNLISQVDISRTKSEDTLKTLYILFNAALFTIANIWLSPDVLQLVNV
jgi:hypothetical protein